MEFVETRTFSARVFALLTPEGYRALQTAIVERPTAGDLIAGTGGLRKLRWATGTKGKRGGARVIYFLHRASHRCLFLLIYGKNEQDDLSTDQKAVLRKIVSQEYP